MILVKRFMKEYLIILNANAQMLAIMMIHLTLSALLVILPVTHVLYNRLNAPVASIQPIDN